MTDQTCAIFDYITSLLKKQPFDFDEKKCMYVKVLSDLLSLEKCHKSILVVRKWQFEAGLAEKYLGPDLNKSNNVLIYCKESSLSIDSTELKFRKKKATVELKSRLLNVLKKTDVNQRLLQIKRKGEIEQSRLKLNSVNGVFDSSLEVYNRLCSQNTRNKNDMDEIVAQIDSVEAKMKDRVVDFESRVKELHTNITEISKEMIKDFTFEKQTPENACKDAIINSDNNVMKAYVELSKIVDSFTRTEELESLKPLSQNESLCDLNWTDFNKNYDLVTDNFLFNIRQNCGMIISVRTLLENLSVMEQTFYTNLKNIGRSIKNIRNERDVSTLILIKLCDELDELKNKKDSFAISNQNADRLEVKYIENVGNLENNIHESNAELAVIAKNVNKKNDEVQRVDSLFNTICQKNINQLNNAYQILFPDDKQSSKATFLYEELNVAVKNHDALLTKRKEIVMEGFKRKSRDMEAKVKEKSENAVSIRNTIALYENKIKTNHQFVKQLEDLNKSKDIVNDDLSLIYQHLMFRYHGKNIEQLNDEETEFTNYVNSYIEELDEINKENERIETYSKHIEFNMNAQIQNLKEKLQQITGANASLEMELDKNTTPRVSV